METDDKKTNAWTRLIERLQDSVQLRICVCGLVLLAGYVGIYWPLSASITETTRKLNREEKRRELARSIEQLRVQTNSFKDRLPAKTDTNEWVQYVLGGIRGFPLKVTTLDPAAAQHVGPYEVVVLHVELEGAFRDLDAFLEWLEGNERLFRVDAVKIAPARGSSDTLQMQLTVLGLMG